MRAAELHAARQRLLDLQMEDEALRAEEAERAEAEAKALARVKAAADRPLFDDDAAELKSRKVDATFAQYRLRHNERDPLHRVDGKLLAEHERDACLQSALREPDWRLAGRWLRYARRYQAIVTQHGA